MVSHPRSLSMMNIYVLTKATFSEIMSRRYILYYSVSKDLKHLVFSNPCGNKTRCFEHDEPVRSGRLHEMREQTDSFWQELDESEM